MQTDTSLEPYTFVFTRPLPLSMAAKTVWKLTASTYGKGGGKMEVVARFVEGMEAPTVRIYRVGMSCYRGTTLIASFASWCGKGELKSCRTELKPVPIEAIAPDCICSPRRHRETFFT